MTLPLKFYGQCIKGTITSRTYRDSEIIYTHTIGLVRSKSWSDDVFDAYCGTLQGVVLQAVPEGLTESSVLICCETGLSKAYDVTLEQCKSIMQH